MPKPPATPRVRYLKRTGPPDAPRHWYWYETPQRISTRRGQPRHPKPAVPAYPSDPRLDERELQVGDVVFHWPGMQFAVLLEFDHGLWRARSRVHEHLFRARATSLSLVHHNLLIGDAGGAPAADNRIGAQLQAELDFAEALGGEAALDYILAALPDIPIGEATLRRLHRRMFGQIYDWAGQYRTEALVVGRRDHPTLDPAEVPDAIKRFFRSFRSPLLRMARNSRQHLLEALLELHTQLAWIHPFRDGNGRTIRMLMDILALQWGYVLAWDLDSAARKRRYHYAVMAAVHRRNSRYLRRLLDRALLRL